ncbi:MAG: molybdate ABC transporter substrate-binding protein [Pseudomonadota bacterium]
MATNFTTTLAAIETDFETESGLDIDVVSGSTGKLYAQIINGAPYDVFLAADQARPEHLIANGHAAPASRFTYAIGKLALWSPTDPEVSANTLTAPETVRLALANPDLAPYGLAAVQLLERLDLDTQLRSKFVFGENVGQAFAFVSTGNAQLGFVSVAQVLTLPETRKGSVWLVPPQLHDPIAQDAVLLTRGADNPTARAFLAYLKSDAAHEIIRRSGYESE